LILGTAVNKLQCCGAAYKSYAGPISSKNQAHITVRLLQNDPRTTNDNNVLLFVLGNSDIQWCFSQVKGTLDDDVTEGEQ
jgi:hypothetical protein